MSDLRTSTATHLRKRAAAYRNLARDAMSAAMARELSAMADDYEHDAVRLDLARRRAALVKAAIRRARFR